MNTVDTVLTVCDILKKEVADKLWLKRPDNTIQNAAYVYTEVHPSVFPLYVPPTDKAGVNPIPCVCVFPLSVTTVKDSTKIVLQFSHVCWDVGTHSDGLWKPKEGKPMYYERKRDHSPDQEFDLYETAWFDMLNFADATRTALIRMGNLGGLRLDVTEPIEQEVATKDMTDNYGIWVTNLAATFEARPAIRKDISDMLY